MTATPPRRRRALRRAGIVLAAMAVVIYAMNLTAMPVVFDVPMIALVFALVAAAALAASLIRVPSQLGQHPPAPSRGPVVILAAVVIVAILSAWERFGTFRTEDVRFQNGEVELAGTLYTPRGTGPFPAVVFVHGSGPETRSEYAYFARRFAGHGFAALAYDKRGTGGSGGRLYASDYHDYARDAAAAAQHLAALGQVDARCVGLIGFSEGEWTAPLAATLVDQVAFLIVIAPSGVSPAEQVNEEMSIRLRRLGHSEADVNRALALNDRVFEYQRSGQVPMGLAEELRRAAGERWFQDAEDIPTELYEPEDYRWWRSVMDYTPGPVWERVGLPVLLVKGDQDQNSTADLAQREIEGALRRGGNDAVEFMRFPDGDHALLRWPLGDRVPPPVFARGYPDAMIKWAVARECAAR